MSEEWKEIPGYGGKYFISSYGNVKAIYKFAKNKEKILSPMINKDGYYQVNLSLHQKVKHCRVHRLVAEAFIDNPNNYSMINHKDENKLNNHADNLEWCNHEYNIRFGTRTKRSFDTRKRNNGFKRILTTEDVSQIRKICIPFDPEFGIKKTAKKYNVTSAAISAIIHGRTWKKGVNN